MYENNDIEVVFNTKSLPIEYKIFEWRLLINRRLYEEKTISLEVFSEMEKSLLGRMNKITNELSKENSFIKDNDNIANV